MLETLREFNFILKDQDLKSKIFFLVRIYQQFLWNIWKLFFPCKGKDDMLHMKHHRMYVCVCCVR